MLAEQGTDDAIPAETLSVGDRFYNDAADEWQTVRELRCPYAQGALVNGRWYYTAGTLVTVRRASGDDA